MTDKLRAKLKESLKTSPLTILNAIIAITFGFGSLIVAFTIITLKFSF